MEEIVNVATPLEFVVAVVGEMLCPVPVDARLAVLFGIGLPAASFAVMVTVITFAPLLTTFVPVSVVTVEILALTGPGTTVITPVVSPPAPADAWMTAVPTKTPVSTALLLSTGATKSPLTMPVGLTNDHVAATFATKLPNWSRVLEYAVNVVPDGTLAVPISAPPVAEFSTLSCVGAPGTDVRVPKFVGIISPLTPAIAPAVIVIFPKPGVVVVGLTFRPLKPRKLAEVDTVLTVNEKDVEEGVMLVEFNPISPITKIPIADVVSNSQPDGKEIVMNPVPISPATFSVIPGPLSDL